MTDLTETQNLHGRDPQFQEKRRKPPPGRSRASRACDRCKGRKTRCSGKYPCTLCSRLRLDCSYTAIYRRGRLPSIEMENGEHDLHPGQDGSVVVAIDQDDDDDDEAHHPNNRRRSGIIHASHQDLQDMRREHQNQQLHSHTQLPHQHQRMPPSPVSSGNRGGGGGSGQVPPSSDTNGHQASATLSSRNSPEPVQTDRQGHYVGPSSGASFLLRIQRKLQQHPSAFSSDTSIFTFGDLPLPESDPRFLILPPRSEAEALLCRYFEFASATHRFLHRPTVEKWLQDLYQTQGTMGEELSGRSKTALLFMVFAMAQNFPKSQTGTVDPTSSARFFSAAEDQLSTEKGSIRLMSVQARLMQCIYLLSHSRINHCWSLFGTAAHLMLALGIHRKSRVDPSRNPDYVDIECRKRTFWCAYNLDTYLSAALGRPRTFHDDDIDQELPLCVDDYVLSRGHMAIQGFLTGNMQSIMAGAVAHIKLSRIVANVLRDLYNIRAPSTENQFKLAARYSQDIAAWRSSVSYLVETDIDPSLFQTIFLRQRNVLNLACWHAQILVHRPFLLNNFASLANLGSTRHRRTQHNSNLTDEHVQKCLEAAMNIVGKIDELSSKAQLYNTYWFSHYFAFCAVVMLYVFAIQQRHGPPETFLPAFYAATKCQTQITSIATPGSLAHRYGVVLQELRLELLRYNSHLLALTTAHRAGTASGPNVFLEGDDLVIGVGTMTQFSDGNILSLEDNGAAAAMLGMAQGHRANGAGAGMGGGAPGGQLDGLPDDGLGISEESPGSSIIQMAGWGQFDSLVTGGMGRLESFLGEEGLDGWELNIDNALGA